MSMLTMPPPASAPNWYNNHRNTPMSPRLLKVSPPTLKPKTNRRRIVAVVFNSGTCALSAIKSRHLYNPNRPKISKAIPL